jgi:dipeptidase D
MRGNNPLFKNAVSKDAYDYFCEILKIPHGSGNEKALSDYLLAFAKKYDLDAVQDESLNILIKKPGGKGRENEPPVILQAHMDMVCEKNEGVKHDFLKDPIIPVIDGDWLRAGGTTLGADNAGGLSLIMAVLAANNLSHPPIEALITTEEETTMSGASKFEVSRLRGKRFINLDSGTEGVFTTGSAAASDICASIPVEYETAPEGFAAYKLMVRGLAGGHSGTDIDKGRTNANILAARLLSELKKARLARIDGGSQKNAIPRECTAVIFFDESDSGQIKTAVEQMEKDLKAERRSDEGLTITLEKTESSREVMSADSRKRVISVMLFTPNGVLSTNPRFIVQTSNNLGVVKTVGKTVKLTCFPRSASAIDQELSTDHLRRLMSAYGASVEVSDQSPPWEYRENSPLRDRMTAAFKEFYGKNPESAAVHAGLECAIFAEKIPDGDFISIGMDITGAHSPDEKMSVSSFDRTGGYLIKALEYL